MTPYSVDLRERIVRAVKDGASTKEVAERFAVSWPSVKRYIKQHRERRDLHPRAKSGRPPALGRNALFHLQQQVKAHHDASLEEHCKLLSEAVGIRVSVTTMHRTLAKLDLTRKKDEAIV